MASSQRICVLSKLVHASERQARCCRARPLAVGACPAPGSTAPRPPSRALQWCRLVIPGAMLKLWAAMQKELQVRWGA